jgi:hypothetical protein
VRFAAITLCVASQRVFIVAAVVYFVMDSVRKHLITASKFRIISKLQITKGSKCVSFCLHVSA